MSRRNTAWNPLGDILALPLHAIAGIIGIVEAGQRGKRGRGGAPNYKCARCGRIGTRGFKQAKRKAPILCESIGACEQRVRKAAR